MGYVEGDFEIPGPKTQVEPVPEGEEDNAMLADDYNDIKQAAEDMREAIVALQGSTPELFDDDSDGIVPASGGGTENFLRADGEWESPGISSSALILADLCDGPDGTVVFDGASTVLGMSPSSSIYTLSRDIFPATMTVNSGVEIKQDGWGIFCSGTLTNNGKITDNGNHASGGTAGAARSGTRRHGPNAAGGVGGSTPGNSGVAPGPWLTTLSATSIPSGAIGFDGGLCQGASGGSGGAGGGNPSAGGGSITLNIVTNNLGVGRQELSDGRTRLNNSILTHGSGGSGGGSGSSGTRGAGGASGGFAHVECRTLAGTGTIEAKGGDGAAGTGNAGGGGGGGGGIVYVVYVTNSGPNTFVVTGGTFGAGGGADGKRGGTGGTGKVIKVNLSGDGT